MLYIGMSDVSPLISVLFYQPYSHSFYLKPFNACSSGSICEWASVFARVVWEIKHSINDGPVRA